MPLDGLVDGRPEGAPEAVLQVDLPICRLVADVCCLREPRSNAIVNDDFGATWACDAELPVSNERLANMVALGRCNAFGYVSSEGFTDSERAWSSGIVGAGFACEGEAGVGEPPAGRVRQFAADGGGDEGAHGFVEALSWASASSAAERAEVFGTEARGSWSGECVEADTGGVGVGGWELVASGGRGSAWRWDILRLSVVVGGVAESWIDGLRVDVVGWRLGWVGAGG